MAVFATVARHGSMSAAARELGISTSAVSQQMRALEREGGVTLLHRTTRRVTLTDAGERLQRECQAMVEAATRAEHALRQARDAPVGELRLAAAVGFARHIAPALAPLLAAHPALTLSLQVDDALIDLVAARIDLALRFGRLPDSSWVARRLGAVPVWICASPAYLARHGAPATPQQLAEHQWLGFTRQRDGFPLALHREGARDRTRDARESLSLRVQPRVTSNNQLSLQQMCAAGLGLARMASMDIDDDLRGGRLVRVMPEWALDPLDVWAVTPQRDAQPAKVRHAVAAMQAYLATLPGFT